jgi:lipoprotein-releasing system permease protein
MRPFWFVAPAVIAMLICLVATLLPAVYAAKLRPADGLRAE